MLTDAERKLVEKYKNKFVFLKAINDCGEEFDFEGKFILQHDDLIRVQQVFNNVKGSKIKFYPDSNYENFNVDFYFDYCEDKFMLCELYDEEKNLIFKNDKSKMLKQARKQFINKKMDQIKYGTEIINLDPVAEKLKTMIGRPIVITQPTEFDADEEGIGVFYGFLSMTSARIVANLSDSYVAIDKNTRLETVTPNGKVVLVEDNNKHDLTDIWKERTDYTLKTLEDSQKAKELEKIKDNKDKEHIDEIEDDDDWWKEK